MKRNNEVAENVTSAYLTRLWQITVFPLLLTGERFALTANLALAGSVEGPWLSVRKSTQNEARCCDQRK